MALSEHSHVNSPLCVSHAPGFYGGLWLAARLVDFRQFRILLRACSQQLTLRSSKLLTVFQASPRR